MKNYKMFLILFTTGLIIGSSSGGAVWAQDTTAKTLLDCYHLALKQSETVAVNQEMIQEAEGQIMEAFSGVLPKVSFAYSETWQESGGTSSSTSSDGVESKFVFSQPLFTGFKEFAAIAAGRSLKKQRHYEWERAKQLLFRDVADAFYFYLSYQQDIEVLENIRATLIDRIDELKKREELGRSRPSELASVEARISRLEADMESVLTEKEVAGQLLEFLTGQAIVTLSDDQPVDKEARLPELSPELIEKRPDVAALKEAFLQGQKQVTIARSGYWPEVSVNGNQYVENTGSSKKDWDVTLSVDVPLFQGGETRGLVRQARSQKDQAELLYQKARRSAVLEIKNAYSRFGAAQRRYEALKKALAATQKNYDLQQEDFRVNLVNNLDVLQALEELQDSQRDHITVQNQMRQYYWHYKVALGEVPR